jgi:hypothetical protein
MSKEGEGREKEEEGDEEPGNLCLFGNFLSS